MAVPFPPPVSAVAGHYRGKLGADAPGGTALGTDERPVAPGRPRIAARRPNILAMVRDLL